MKNRWHVVMVTALVISLWIGKTAFTQHQLSGVVLYAGNVEWPMDGVTVSLYDLQGSLVMSAETDDAGMYLLEGVPDGQYELLCSTDAEPRGVDIADAYFILMHLMGFYNFDDIGARVADVDGSGAVTWNDYTLVAVDHLLYGESFPVGDWIFQEHLIDLSARSVSAETDTSWGFVSGDVGLTESNGGGGRAMNYIEYQHSEWSISGPSGWAGLKVWCQEELYGFKLELVYQPDKYKILSIEGPDRNLHHYLNPQTGELKLVWLNEEMEPDRAVTSGEFLSIEIQPLREDAFGDVFHVDAGTFLDADGQFIQDVVLDLPYLKEKVTGKPVANAAQLYPNPVKTDFTLEIRSAEQTQASVSFFDLMGRKVAYHDHLGLEKGTNRFQFNTLNFTPGHYFYEVHIGSVKAEKLTGRMWISSR